MFEKNLERNAIKIAYMYPYIKVLMA